MSCQTRHFLSPLISREIANINQLKFKKHIVEREVSLGPYPRYIHYPDKNGVKSVSFKVGEALCNGINSIRYIKDNKEKYFLSESSSLKCRALKSNKIKLKYEFNLIDESDLTNLDYLNLVKNRFKNADLFNDFLIESKVQQGITKRMSLSQLNNIKFSKGDFIKVEFIPQKVKHQCQLDKSFDFIRESGALTKDLDQEYFSGMRQLKYPHLDPFITFCGGRFSASNIHLNSKENSYYFGYIDENGFSCDTNTYLFSKNNPKVIVDVTYISSEKFISGQVSHVDKYFKTLELFNNAIEKSELRYKDKSAVGYLELKYERDHLRTKLSSINLVSKSKKSILEQRALYSFNIRGLASIGNSLNGKIHLCPNELRRLLNGAKLDSPIGSYKYRKSRKCLIKK